VSIGEVVIEARFNGPPGSGNGGYAAGRLATFVDAPAVTVRLSVPPPLERPMAVVEVEGGAELRDGDVVVATARPGELALEVPVVVDPVAAQSAARDAPWAEAAVHPFPTCFGCGPLREAGDALRHMAGRVAGDVVACPACTDERLPHDESGHLLPEVVWASLDCPSAAAGVPVGGPPHVLATFTVCLERRVPVGEPHVVVAWPLGADGRKKWAASALLDAAGRTCAIGEALWIEVRR
jgi:hypothetical protein